MFYKVPKALFTEEKYQKVSTDAKMLYGLLLDRMYLSVKNGWVDKQNRIYQFFTVREAQEKLHFGHEKICFAICSIVPIAVTSYGFIPTPSIKRFSILAVPTTRPIQEALVRQGIMCGRTLSSR